MVVWNPGEEKGAQLNDLEANRYLRMVCVKAASITRPITLCLGESWSGSQVMQLLRVNLGD